MRVLERYDVPSWALHYLTGDGRDHQLTAEDVQEIDAWEETLLRKYHIQWMDLWFQSVNPGHAFWSEQQAFGTKTLCVCVQAYAWEDTDDVD